VPLSQIRDRLGHASIVTTERYDNQRPEALMAAAKRLETGNLSHPLHIRTRTECRRKKRAMPKPTLLPWRFGI
jgi:hypothetical protein